MPFFTYSKEKLSFFYEMSRLCNLNLPNFAIFANQ